LPLLTTADDAIRKLFEPSAPPIKDRIKALDELHKAGIKTYAMIAPVLPGAEELAELLKGKIDYLLFLRALIITGSKTHPDTNNTNINNGLLNPAAVICAVTTAVQFHPMCMKMGI